MSLDATIWAFKAEVKTSSQRLVLLALADRAGESHKCYPSIKRMVKDTVLNRKTIIKVLDELEAGSFIKFTGEITGNGVKVYQLIGVMGREEDSVTSPKIGTSTNNGTSSNFGTGSKNGTSTNIGTATSPKNGTETSTNIGTQNLSRNLSDESKNKKTWLSLKKLREEILLATDQETYEQIKNATWFDRELRAFELYNAAKNLCDELMHYHFADWLINACGKYQAREQAKIQNTTTRVLVPQGESNQLSDKQVHTFAQKLSQHPEFASQFAAAGESYDQLAARIAVKLSDPAQAKQWEPYLKQVGFKGTLQGAA
ncbi:TPA: helix-turn-helix domain-containing protein [Acinetobacter baumannii]|uniref:helix-turn-helix domain-containing protein n=1 Tax=Acinetobacter baumannii TaxID=470 RepID=UPI000BF6E706|nr:helix-turn-helix domain-containing protein [Acinetobacter baumannii]MDK2223281.1 helix-turn-helix domain-containing protein [Acinetobacter baumannii]MDK2234171.1 helix-turn-helix domain-containing protein [Acinetobacter baumannii]MDR9625214.1 helix-turn-helix domain-containing protein [Acinetobacter baumannii]HCR0015922.1 helix-turn-helix domain-containing protein [Acinetobacter baumannii]HDI1577790.1 helix-turn-helix domain-containing protein [Acinetobacter baumannii]